MEVVDEEHDAEGEIVQFCDMAPDTEESSAEDDAYCE